MVDGTPDYGKRGAAITSDSPLLRNTGQIAGKLGLVRRLVAIESSCVRGWPNHWRKTHQAELCTAGLRPALWDRPRKRKDSFRDAGARIATYVWLDSPH